MIRTHRRALPTLCVVLSLMCGATLGESDAADPPSSAESGKGAESLPEGATRAIEGRRTRIESSDLLAVSPDSTVLAVSSPREKVPSPFEIHLLDVKTGKRLPGGFKNVGGERIVLGPGSKLLGTVSEDALQVWDCATGKLLHTLCRSDKWWHPDLDKHALAFSPDARVLAHANRAAITSWDLATGKELKARRVESPQEDMIFTCATFSPDERFLVAGTFRPKDGEGGRVQLYDATTGRLRQTLKGRGDLGVHQTWLTADGRLLASLTADGKANDRPRNDDFGRAILGSATHLRVWELASGQEVLDLPVPNLTGITAAFSRSGRFFAGDNPGNGILLWDTVSGKRIHAWKRRGSGYHLTFVEDDKALMIEEKPDLYFFDVASRVKSLSDGPVPDREALARLWADLAGDDAARARRAVWVLADSPKQSLPLLADKLKPVPEVSDKELSRLIRDLDANKYATREQARSDLQKLRELAEPALRRALDNDPSAELSRALKELLSALDRPITDKEKLRRLRAVEALEHSGTKEAQAVLKEMAKGAPAALETQGAKEALERLARRQPAKP